MSSPTDNPTDRDQTQAATQGHTNYHRGCSAWQTYLNTSAAGSLSTSQPPSTSALLPTITQDQANNGSNTSNVSTGAIIAIANGGICSIAVAIAATIIIWKCLKNQADGAAGPAVLAGATNEKGNRAMAAPYALPTTTPARTWETGSQTPLLCLTRTNHEPAHVASVHVLRGLAVAGNIPGGARPETMFSDSPTMSTRAGSSHPPNMRQRSEFGGSSNSGRPLLQGQYQVTNDLGPQRAGLSSSPPPWSQEQPQP
ncbi:hypothetical protein M407DRAFT_224392 [Tulasnella calospora MUT 4182]|uniref:Uncharacterized protein n=1 Tax=Tulasnella calospora MUT 4182 TaxID=1051891 RepID=A0A0C3QPY1_9AGAM|nr:hypothetical protein M407DRAFT_224392 [Tulasnella calospora MUT 4182]